MFMWRSLYHNRLARWGDTLFISAGEESPVYLPPIGPSPGRPGVQVLLERSAGQERPLTLVRGRMPPWSNGWRTPSPAGSLLPLRGRFRLYLPHEGSGGAAGGAPITPNATTSLVFPGNSTGPFEPIDGRNTAEVEAMAQEWCRQKGNCKDKGLRTENCAIREVLRHREALSVRGRLIPCRRPCRGLHVPVPLSTTRLFDIQVEKALPSLSGGVRRHQSGIRLDPDGVSVSPTGRTIWISRDCARRSSPYHPAMVLEKYTCTQVR